LLTLAERCIGCGIVWDARDRERKQSWPFWANWSNSMAVCSLRCSEASPSTMGLSFFNERNCKERRHDCGKALRQPHGVLHVVFQARVAESLVFSR